MTHTIESQCGVTFFRRGSPPEEWRCKASALTDGRGHGGMDGLMRGISVSRGPALSKCRASRGVTKFLHFATLCPLCNPAPAPAKHRLRRLHDVQHTCSASFSRG